MGVGHRIAHPTRHFADHAPIRENPVRRVHRLPDPLDAAFEIGERTVFFQERRARQHEMGEPRGLAHEQVLHHKKLHFPERLVHFLEIRIGLRHVVADDPERV